MIYSLYLLLFSLTIANAPIKKDNLDKMVGNWKIEAYIKLSPQKEAELFYGKSSWKHVFNDRYVKEEFEFKFRGDKIIGEAFLGKSSKLDLYEFVQIDNANPSIFMLSGEWDSIRNKIELKSVSKSNPIKWTYEFLDDGSFIKKIILTAPDGIDFIQSEYHYLKKT